MSDVITKETINARNWELLFDAIEKERVVPIIGGEFFNLESSDGQGIGVDCFVMNKLKERFNVQEEDVDYTLISDVIEAENYRNRRSSFIGNQTDIYYEIDNVLRNINVSCDSDVVKFLSIKRFPLIMTTSCVAGLESEMRTCYGNIDVKVYDKSARSDIDKSLTAERPTLYYLFGRVNRIKKSFMVTEDDLLDYLHLWHNLETRPVRLGDYLKDKFLLVLGCNYPNWLFRFFWHSIRNFTIVPNSFEMQGVVAMENANSDKELMKFLSRIQTQIFENSKKFIEEFMLRWNSRQKASDGNQSHQDYDNTDIFISYAKEDVVVVRGIADRLRELGAEVWLDENKLEWSDLYESIIQEKIKKTKRFVPIISHTTLKKDRSYFRREWAMADEENQYRYGMPYFAPIVIDDIDVYSPLIPETFKKAHIISISDKDFESEMKKLIRSFR